MDELTIGTLAFASCTGCHMAMVDTGEVFLSLLSEAKLAFSPVLMDNKEVAEADLVLVEGGVRNEEDACLLEEARVKSRTLVALGTCATFGGVAGLANQERVDDLVFGVYGDVNPDGGLPPLRPRLVPLDAHVEVDYYIPGCPPPSDHLSAILLALATGKEPPRFETPVCSECGRTAGPEPLEALARPFSKVADAEKCLLVQGILCLGSVTRGGCGAACTGANVPCAGCRGPTDRLLLDSRHGIYRDIVSRISHLLGLSLGEVEEELADLPHTLYSYALASQSLRRKDAERVSQLVYRIKE
jgi:F420-non-reducing hydrogenase small subunit